MKKLLAKGGLGAGLWALPVLVLAQSGDFGNLNALGGNIIGFINGTLVPLVFAVAFLVFVWGVARYFIFSQGNEDAKENAKNLMLYGLIGFFVMVAIWGIVNLLVGAASLDGQAPTLPQAPDIN